MFEASFVKSIQVRNGKAWVDIFNEAITLVNSSINAQRILSVSTTLCHYDRTGSVTVFYNDSQADNFTMYASQSLAFEVIRDQKSWKDHNLDVQQALSKLVVSGYRILTTSQLEINEKHEECLTVIWYLRNK